MSLLPLTIPADQTHALDCDRSRTDLAIIGRACEMNRALISVFAAVGLVVAGGSVATASDGAPPRTTHGPCQYTQTPDEP